ncbi:MULTISPECIES: WYL domain-containing protein [unclassified Enterobacter]|jgi:predicted DNA-binding transcriptional regulator YafY|uniref:helix-turn-helix transcriptional regulator n=1 Tax=unclassified Enterobacter TaxID=2608935 RepID=UPI0015CD6C3C|nr:MULTISPECIES: WYL domain-containing protein [unclassified Enterobacter]MBB3303901.1 putative DNA-binding transcriptional regulator YafY [Enterobacter sp. Sphag1F]NYI12994.1 putative DNA-binding transcriptional regulator YafY [Enterobacter sp. Sphag71]
MSAQKKQHDRMASRLAVIISRLLIGERLEVKKLAHEFMISERTLRRDFRERLSCLELQYVEGGYSLVRLQDGIRTNRDILHFAHVTCTEQLFPAMDSKLISILIDSAVESPFIVSLAPPDRKPSLFGGFWRITQAILDRTLLDLTVDGQQHRWFAPYRLIYFEHSWYLVGENRQKLQVFILGSITDVLMTRQPFLRRRQIDELTGEQHFIQSLPHFQYVRRIIENIGK